MEYFGFSLNVGATVAYLAVLVWAITPQSFFIYFPSRWWAVASSAYVLVLLGFIYVALASYNCEVLTIEPTSLETVTDPVAKIETDPRYLHESCNAVKDLPLSSVNRVLYFDGAEDDDNR